MERPRLPQRETRRHACFGRSRMLQKASPLSRLPPLSASHVAAIVPGESVVVRPGEGIFRIDDGDYRIVVAAARASRATQRAASDRVGRQVSARESAVEQAKAQLASADAALKRGGLDFA